MTTIAIAELFTKIAFCATLYSINSEGPYFFFQRYSLAPKKDISEGVLVLLLNDYFPGLVFFPKNSGDIGVANYVVQENGKWTLDINAMSKSREKIFSGLFPEDISGWDEAEARARYGCADIIRFFIDAENKMFLGGSSNVSGRGIPCRFFDELDYSGKPVWEDWDFSALVIHKMRRRPPAIYEAFGYYAHRLYTLLSFAPGSGNTACEERIKSGSKLLNETIMEQIPGIANLGIDRLTSLFEMIQETLESVPVGSSIYAPTELEVFIKQLKMKMTNLYKNSGFMETSYSASERKTINNHIEKALRFITDGEDLLELNKLGLTGTYREKINLLHRIVCGQRRKGYSQRERNIIHGLFLKQLSPVSLDKMLGGDEDGNTFAGHDLVCDDKYTVAEDYLAWSSFFRDEFAAELDKDSLEKFIECLPDHFSRHPFDIDSDGNLSISKYSRKVLFSTFCSVAGIAPDSELWKPFLILMQRVVVNINKGGES
jgi:hypothetical protein